MRIERIGASRWASMSADAKRELVSCYEQDLHDAAHAAGTTVDEAEVAFIGWLDDEMSRAHTTYYVGRITDKPVTLLRVHEDQVPGALLIEALQTVPSAQGKGLASQLLATVLRMVPGVYCADVHSTNEASQATFARAGFAKTPGPIPGQDRWRLDTTRRPADHSG